MSRFAIIRLNLDIDALPGFDLITEPSTSCSDHENDQQKQATVKQPFGGCAAQLSAKCSLTKLANYILRDVTESGPVNQKRIDESIHFRSPIFDEIKNTLTMLKNSIKGRFCANRRYFAWFAGLLISIRDYLLVVTRSRLTIILVNFEKKLSNNHAIMFVRESEIRQQSAENMAKFGRRLVAC